MIARNPRSAVSVKNPVFPASCCIVRVAKHDGLAATDRPIRRAVWRHLAPHQFSAWNTLAEALHTGASSEGHAIPADKDKERKRRPWKTPTTSSSRSSRSSRIVARRRSAVANSEQCRHVERFECWGSDGDRPDPLAHSSKDSPRPHKEGLGRERGFAKAVALPVRQIPGWSTETSFPHWVGK